MSIVLRMHLQGASKGFGDPQFNQLKNDHNATNHPVEALGILNKAVALLCGHLMSNE